MDVLKWAREQNPPCPWDAWGCGDAAQCGHLAVLKWMREQTPPCPWDAWTWNAALGGQLEVLQWLREQGCPWDEEACEGAAHGGELAVLRWLREQNPPCPWDGQTCERAAEFGQLEAGPDTSPLSQLNLSSCVPVTTQLIPLIHSEMLKLS